MANSGRRVDDKISSTTAHALNSRVDGRSTRRRVYRRSMFRCLTVQCTKVSGAIQFESGPEIFEAARPITTANDDGSGLFANGGVGLVKAFHLNHSTTFPRSSDRVY
jgi:hypothetical protein